MTDQLKEIVERAVENCSDCVYTDGVEGCNFNKEEAGIIITLACQEAVDAALVDAWTKKYAEQEAIIRQLREQVKQMTESSDTKLHWMEEYHKIESELEQLRKQLEQKL
jgi:hypothetical protein